MTPRLAAVPDKPPDLPEKPPRSVSQAAATGDRHALLVAMRSRVATAVEDANTPARDLAALTRRLMEIARDIEAMDARDGEAASSAGTPDESFDASAI